ncbi:ecdysteroid-regulated 16 kDa protein-like [Diachasmimorpha longicaudata]|uniref:ecdysteroid-regulated 16 kDa protein-like n=1 Tax=Diachasmimorpha longicaudata TaxID=58733 RepID=UPI0030B87235
MFGKTAILFTTVLCFVTFGESTDVLKCKNGGSFDTIKSIVITKCEQPPCLLKRGTRVELVQQFVPEKNVEKLTTSVHATLLGVPLPFVGVDGTDACPNIFDADGKPGCPLKAGTQYYYKNGFPVLNFYPTVDLVVAWALLENNVPLTCFEIPAKIIR